MKRDGVLCKISIVLPSLNVVEYIEECLTSVISQTLVDIEIICVDACSEDGTADILNKYASADPRINVINCKKRSYGYQVNLGIQMSQGEYIGIVETDDFIDRRMYEILYMYAKENDLDCVKGDFWYTTGKQACYVRERKYAVKCHSDYYNVLISDNLRDKFMGYMYTWAGIYKKDFLVNNEIFHNESDGASYQDNGFWFQTMMYSKRLMFIPYALYNLRRDNPDSSFFSTGKIKAISEEYDFIHTKIEEAEVEDKDQLFKLCSLYRLKNQIGRLANVSADSVKDCFSIMVDDLKKAREKQELEYGIFDDKLVKYAEYALNGGTAVTYLDFLKEYGLE